MRILVSSWVVASQLVDGGSLKGLKDLNAQSLKGKLEREREEEEGKQGVNEVKRCCYRRWTWNATRSSFHSCWLGMNLHRQFYFSYIFIFLSVIRLCCSKKEMPNKFSSGCPFLSLGNSLCKWMRKNGRRMMMHRFCSGRGVDRFGAICVHLPCRNRPNIDHLFDASRTWVSVSVDHPTLIRLVVDLSCLLLTRPGFAVASVFRSVCRKKGKVQKSQDSAADPSSVHHHHP